MRRYLFYVRVRERLPRLHGRLRGQTTWTGLEKQNELAMLTGIPRDDRAIPDVLKEYDASDVFEFIAKLKPHKADWRERLRIWWCLIWGDYIYPPNA